MSSENTAVYVHESRFPLRILKHLVKAGPAGVGNQVKRLDALFRYEANAQERSPDAGTQSFHSSSRQGSTISGSAGSHEKGKAKQTAADAAGAQASRVHNDEYYKGSTLDNENGRTSEILTFESPIEGLVTQWCVPEGQLLRDP